MRLEEKRAGNREGGQEANTLFEMIIVFGVVLFGLGLFLFGVVLLLGRLRSLRDVAGNQRYQTTFLIVALFTLTIHGDCISRPDPAMGEFA